MALGREEKETPGAPLPYDFLSNLDKVFWPSDGYTKRDLLEFYHNVADLLLPYLKDRPMVLERFPDGIEGKSFYQKEAPEFLPEWVSTVAIKSESTEKNHSLSAVSGSPYIGVSHQSGLHFTAPLEQPCRDPAKSGFPDY